MLENERRFFALIIGIDHYLDPNISDLDFACSDAQDFHDHLTQTLSADEADINLLLNEQASLRAVRMLIGENLARKAQPDDIVLLFFAGHGSPESDNTVDALSRYLVMHDTQYDNIFATALDLERDFSRLLERIRSRYIVVFIDACFSGRAGGRTFEGPTLHRMREQFRSPFVQLKNLDLGEGRIVISACDDMEVAREDAKFSHGVFTFCLLEALVQDAPTTPTISIPVLYDIVAAKVAHLTNGRQHPVFNGRGRSPQIPFLKPKRA